jgi:peptide/nickel transport system substrate-binding protein
MRTSNLNTILIFFLITFFLLGCSPDNSETLDSSIIYLTQDVPVGLNNDGPAASIPESQIGIVNLQDALIDYALDTTQTGDVRSLNFQEFEGRLAEQWFFDKKSLTWIFKLRKNVISCAGNELTADDVVYTFARAKSVSGAAPIGWFLSSVASIKGFDNEVLSNPESRKLGDEVRKIDRYTVAIKQSAPNKLFLPALSTFGIRVFDSIEAKKHSTKDDPWSHDYINNVSLPGFGAYCLESWSKGNEFIITANKNYYRGEPKIKRVVFKRIPQSSNRFIIMRMNQADIAYGLTPREFIKLEEFDGIKVVGITGNQNLFLHMNFTTPPFDNINIRRAVAASIPYDWIIRNAYFNQASVWNSLVPSRYPGADSNFTLKFKGISEAKRILKAEGYLSQKDFDVHKDSFKLSYVAEKEDILGPVANAIRTEMIKAGFPVELDPIPLTQYGDRQLVKRDLPFAINSEEKPIVVDAGYAVQLFFASATAGGVNNMVNYSNKKVDDLWAKARVSEDEKERFTLLTEIYKLLERDITWLPIAEYKTRWGAKENINGFVWYPDNGLRFFDLRVDNK